MTADPAGGPDLSVVLMTYNEAESLAGTVAELRAVFEQLEARCELLIVDDGSTDGSAALADQLAARCPGSRVIHHGSNLGLGGVYRTGFAEARGTFLSFFPADGQFPAGILVDFFSLAEHADLVLGYLPRSRWNLAAQVLSLAERVLYRVLLGPMPRFQGVFMLRRSLLEALGLATTGRGWGILMEMILRTGDGGFRIIERPTGYRPRRAGRSKVTNPRVALENLRQLFVVRRLLRKPQRALRQAASSESVRNP